jgi:alkaline phosphatase D
MRALPFSFSLALALSAAPSAAASEPHPPALVSRIAFGSCIRPEYPQDVWKTVLRDEPDAFVLLGDNVYGDTEDMETLRGKYARLDATPGFAKLRRAVPLLATWDDHDYGVNDGGAEYPRKAESREVFLDFVREPKDSPRRAREGVYDARIWGPPGRRVQFILLDTRTFRGPLRRLESGGYGPDTSGRTVLGEAQWRWLEEQLRAPAELRLIASSIQVISEEHPYEKWSNFPRERQRLFDLLRVTGAGGVVFLSGDRHMAELSRLDEAGTGYPLYDLTASPLAAVVKANFSQESNRHRVGVMNWGQNYGWIEVDWKEKDPRVKLEIRDLEGDAAFSRKLRLSDLRPYLVDRIPLRLWGKPFFGSR